MGGLSKDNIIELSAYGEMGFGGVSETQSITQNNWTIVTNGDNNLWSTGALQLKDITYSDDTLIIGKDGLYFLNCQLSLNGSSNSILRLGIYVNDVLACICTGYQQLLNNRIVQLTYVDILDLKENDVIKVVITNTANSNGVDAIAGKLAINRIG